GSGPSLVLVHGTAADHARWNIVLPRLSARYTCYVMDRRGRAESGDAREYALEREAEDVLAVVASVPGPVRLMGHSFGGLCAMEAASRTRKLSHLVLYEPAAFVPGNDVYGDDVIGDLEWLLAKGDREGLVVRMLRDVAGIP